MMRASRSFSVAYSAATADVRSTEKKKKTDPKKPKSSHKRLSAEKESIESASDGGADNGTVAITAATAAKPMVIPPRTLRSLSADDAKKELKKRQSSLPTQTKRDGISPAVAAVLSSTAIPSRRPSLRRPSIQPKRAASLTVVAEEAEKEKAVENGRSALDLLLSPPEDDEELQDPMEKLSVTPTANNSSFMRKHSNESVPSLDTDDESISSMSNPSTPRSGLIARKGSIGERRIKQVSSPPIESCLSDHPLLFRSVDPQTEFETMLSGSEPELQVLLASAPRKRKISLKSNLTASLRVLKSAAKSFSNLYPPLTHPDDFLTRSILSISPQFTDEKRPVLLDETPTPALRRYLNPSPAGDLKPLGHRVKVLGLSPSEDSCTASIQLETYRVSKSAKKAAPSPPAAAPQPASTPASPLLVGPVGRQREVRENSNFLRVIVLEMNMRREGKLTDYAHGKARFVLPPRQVSKKESSGAEGGIPSRWVAMVYDDESSDEESDSDSCSSSGSSDNDD